MKDIVALLLKKEMDLKKEEIMNLLEVPPKPALGDYAFPCFSLAKQKKQSPIKIAEDLVEKLRLELSKEISNVSMNAGYVNFFVDKTALAKQVLKNVKEKSFGSKGTGKGKKIAIEYPGPNTNKPLHIGHVRNLSIGESIARILETNGTKVIRTNINNDRGVHICKSMIGYKKFYEGKTPETENKKSDHFVGDCYVAFGKAVGQHPELEEKAQEFLKKWEEGDKKTIALWKKMNNWAYKGWKETYKLFGLQHDKEYYESETYKGGKDIVMKGLKKGIFKKKKDGAIYIDLKKEGLGEKIVLRADGTALYITFDLNLAVQRNKDFKLNGIYHVVGNEQEYYFKTLFATLKKLGYSFSNNLHHLSYGMLSLPGGKIKSRTGKTADADDLIEQVKKQAKKSLIEKSSKMNKKELERRALIIAMAALKYHLLKIDMKKNTVFDTKEALRFEGDTGPYLLYTYARASSILRKVKSTKPVKIIDLKEKEIALLKKIDSFNEVILRAYGELAPNLIANYSYELSKLFNEFYHDCPVLGSIEEGFRLKLVEAFRIVSKKALDLLGIDALEEM